MLKKIVLGLTERHVAHQLLATIGRVDIDAARMVRAVRENLDLRDAGHAVDKMANDVREAREQAVADGFTQEQAVAEFPAVSWDDILDSGEVREYTIDESYLRWLRDLLMDHEFGVVKTEDGEELEIGIPVGQMIAVANLADALTDALTGE